MSLRPCVCCSLAAFAMAWGLPALAETPLEACYAHAGNQGRTAVGPCLESMLRVAEQEMTAALADRRKEAADLAKVTGRDASVTALAAAQRAFLAYRQAQCEYLMAAMDAGTGAGDVQRDCMVRLTQQRTVELRTQP